MRCGLLARPSAAALLLAGVLPAGAFEVQCLKDVVYGQAGDVPLLLDLYRPIGAEGPRPGVLFVHGGGWTRGQRSSFADHCAALAARGFVAASCDYRLAPDYPYPAALDDCQRAMRWLRSQAAELALDPNRLGAVGSSAGGHLVACLGVRDTRDPQAPLAEYSSRATVVVDVHGIHELTAFARHRNCVEFVGGPPADIPEVWREASPLSQVDEQSVPFLILHDPADPTVEYEQSVLLVQALVRAGRPVQFEPTPGSGHGYVYNLKNAHAARVWPLIVAWLERWLS